VEQKEPFQQWGQRERLQQRKSEKNEQYSRLSHIISTLQEKLDYEDDPLRRMRLQKEIEEKEEERNKVDKEINAIEERLEG
jgi:hypothetical protein